MCMGNVHSCIGPLLGVAGRTLVIFGSSRILLNISDGCYTDCPYGYKFDAYGIETCRCQTLSPECPALEHCSRKCAHGYKQSKKGCPKCRCYKCPDISDCTKSCSYGYLTNKHGCHVCKCLGKYRKCRSISDNLF